jgi:two-component system CheB/CheR fusion protein
VLNFSKLSGEKDRFEWTDLNAVVRDLIDDFELMIREKNATVDIGNLPSAEVIPEQIRQVFQNLLSNALKFSRPDVSPIVTIHGSEMSNGTCKISVEDNGIGFENEYQEMIFELFERLHSKDKYEGSGIGLAIAKKIIEKHSGSITVVSRKGQGTIFEITLPVRQSS